jgi:outer membrane usher protein FimD/PapC
MLFYSKAIKGYKKVVNEHYIQVIADNITLTSKRVEETFGLKMIFVACPNKYTIYGDFAAAPEYNELIPLLVEALGERGVVAVDLTQTYDEYRTKQGDGSFLYYQSDTHWNELGTDVAVDEIVQFLDNFDK